ncbi:unnamed protein product [Cunninghamella echinulata]
MVVVIEHLSQIPTQTSKWENEHVIALNIEYKNVENIDEIIQPSDLTEEDNFKKLILKNWKKEEFLLTDEYINEKEKDKKILTIIKKIRTVLGQEMYGDYIKVTQIDSFVTSLLFYLGFDDDPYLTHPQYDYSIYLDDGQCKITSKVEFMITYNDAYVVLIIEDKHYNNVSVTNDWSEPQIAGEIFGAIFHNIKLSTRKQKEYPFDIYALRIINTKITFYKTTFNLDYVREVETRLPIKHKLEIKRFPQQLGSLPNKSKILSSLDFTIDNDRFVILSLLKSLYIKANH